ncbi:hypothetical protein LTR36_007492 [Oleoguttula mirabilis]|uniref:Uncharacterized protein n=1 Tax=Oleoguttula mirabilis TaxID=1507867 RepID=A0AAV9JVE7_9PEZI|nr:hypothetical protein LTR36_007492 [Oleoguttula mirabilis]
MAGEMQNDLLLFGIMLLAVALRFLEFATRARHNLNTHESTASPSVRLMDLPQELRDEILELAVTETRIYGYVPYEEHARYGWVDYDGRRSLKCRWYDFLRHCSWLPWRRVQRVYGTYCSLLLVNRRINAETSGLLFKHNQFDFSFRPAAIRRIRINDILTARGTIMLHGGTLMNGSCTRSHHTLSFRRKRHSNVYELVIGWDSYHECRYPHTALGEDGCCDDCKDEIRRFEATARLVLERCLSRSKSGDTQRMTVEMLAAGMSEAVKTNLSYVCLSVNEPAEDNEFDFWGWAAQQGKVIELHT